MSTPIPAAAIHAYVVDHLAKVFETMLSLPATPAPEVDARQFPERVTGSVGFAGDKVSGTIYLHLSAEFAAQAAGAMLGLSPEELSDPAEINDVVGEITNMLGGGLKSWLCDAGATCVLTAPAVIRGTSFAVVASPGVERIQLGFASGPQNGLVEVHIKFR
jgi:chemotaxis protein CheX